jgi:hypothetical protein
VKPETKASLAEHAENAEVIKTIFYSFCLTPDILIFSASSAPLRDNFFIAIKESLKYNHGAYKGERMPIW